MILMICVMVFVHQSFPRSSKVELSCLVVVVTTELALEVLRRALLLRVVLVVLAVLEIESVQV